jgi:hypothetical protein
MLTERFVIAARQDTMKNDSCEQMFAWFDVSSKFIGRSVFVLFNTSSCIDKLNDERHWTRKYIEFDRRQRLLTFYADDVRLFCLLVSPCLIIDEQQLLTG